MVDTRVELPRGQTFPPCKYRLRSRSAAVRDHPTIYLFDISQVSCIAKGTVMTRRQQKSWTALVSALTLPYSWKVAL